MAVSQFYQLLEKKLISKKNRFKLSKIDLFEIKNDFKNKNILIAGAAGSIGSQFIKDLIELNIQPKKIFLLDKDENLITELNREIVLICKKKLLNRINIVCSDLTSLNLDNFLFINKITHYLNFAAIKHVRSEEN